MMRKVLRCLLGSLVTVMLSTGVANSAGVLDLDRFPVRAPRIDVLGASAAGVLYRVTGDDDLAADQITTWVKPTGGTPYQVPFGYDRLAGTRIFGNDPATGYVRYQVIGTPADVTCDSTTPQPGAITSFGWIATEAERVELRPGGCVVTARYPHEGGVIAADEIGFVVRGGTGENGVHSLIYHSYADPAHPRQIDDGGYNRYIGGVALRGSDLTWAVLDYARPGKSFVLRAKTDGSAALRVTTVDALVATTSIAAGATGWAACYYSGGCSSGSIDSDGTVHQLSGTRTVVSDGTRFLFDTHGTDHAVDAAAAVDETTPRTRIVGVPLLPPVAMAVSLGAGGVVYVDSQLPRDSVNQRGYTRSGSTVTLSPQTRIAQTAGPSSVDRDGRRTAYKDVSGDLWLYTDGGVRTRVFDAAEKVAIAGHQVWLSGTRMLWWMAKYRGQGCDMATCFPIYHPATPMLYGVGSGVSTQLVGPVEGKPAALWANYLAYADSANAIWRRDLSSNALVQVKAAGGAPVANVDVHDDHVAWSTCVPGTTNWCATSTVAFRNMATRAAAQQIATSSTQQIRLSGGHVVYDTYAEQHFPPTGTLKVLRLGTTATGTVAAIKSDSSFAVHDETLAWIGTDRVARIGPNSSFIAGPRFLGNSLGTASFTPSAGSWTPEFGISKALPTCYLTIRSGTTVRRVLTCGTAVGSARPSWNGRDSAGRLVAKGTYTWTLTGSDADGSLRWWTNAGHPITGTVRVT